MNQGFPVGTLVTHVDHPKWIALVGEHNRGYCVRTISGEWRYSRISSPTSWPSSAVRAIPEDDPVFGEAWAHIAETRL